MNQKLIDIANAFTKLSQRYQHGDAKNAAETIAQRLIELAKEPTQNAGSSDQ